MNKLPQVIGVLILGLLVSPAAAVELNGGDFNLEYSWFDQDIGDTTVDTFSFDGSVEVGFSHNLAAQLDLGRYKFGFINETGTNGALHAIYNLNESTALGAFYSVDEIFSESTDFYGIEAVYDTDQFELEAYIGRGEDAGVDGSVYGVLGAFSITESIDITGSAENASFDGDVDFSKYAIGMRFFATPKVAFTTSIGSFEANAFGLSGSETFFSVGAEFKFGQNEGATFGKRGLLTLIPGL
ncbi:hypothetical protein SAMN05444004_101567 [Jannaschia faecimaris]|uniref:Porin n=1 Tax=Jannaschia faecimaris TaxID=1244108 RepID=A0A1H3KAL2_9RHOB|nr:hypothetical protein [Jannaschia faecimaris]SDY49143.1 hypothetical protein SAMN05444004_101567 [Jannaschia faecimaris]